MKIILIAIIIVLIILILSKSKEDFIDIYTNIITFRQLNGILIKSYKINSFYSLYDTEINKLFYTNDIISINIPLNYSVSIRYSFKNDSSIIAKIIELPYGTYNIYKSTNDKIINQIDIKNMNGYNNNIIVTNNQSMPMYWDTDLYNSYRPEYYYTARPEEYYYSNTDNYNYNHYNKDNYNHYNKDNYNHNRSNINNHNHSNIDNHNKPMHKK